MNFDAGTIQRNSFNTDADDLLMLKLLKYDSGRHSLLSDSCGYRGLPVAEALELFSLLATMLGNVKNGIESLQIGMTNLLTRSLYAPE